MMPSFTQKVFLYVVAVHIQDVSALNEQPVAPESEVTENYHSVFIDGPKSTLVHHAAAAADWNKCRRPDPKYPSKRIPYMEDRVIMKRGMQFSDGSLFDYYAVFDGHGGDFTAQWLAQRFHNLVKDKIQDVADDNSQGMMQALSKAFEVADKNLRGQQTKCSGSTGTVAIIRNETVAGQTKRVLYTANVGDSEAMLIAKNGSMPESTFVDFYDARPYTPENNNIGDHEYRMLTAMHHPKEDMIACPLEIERVNQAVAASKQCVRLFPRDRPGLPKNYIYTYKDGRDLDLNAIDGAQNSRTFGDFNMKLKRYENAVIATPSISRTELGDHDGTLVIASDGLWDVMHPRNGFDQFEDDSWPTDSDLNSSSPDFAFSLFNLAADRAYVKQDNIGVITVDLCAPVTEATEIDEQQVDGAIQLDGSHMKADFRIANQIDHLPKGITNIVLNAPSHYSQGKIEASYIRSTKLSERGHWQYTMYTSKGAADKGLSFRVSDFKKTSSQKLKSLYSQLKTGMLKHFFRKNRIATTWERMKILGAEPDLSEELSKISAEQATANE